MLDWITDYFNGWRETWVQSVIQAAIITFVVAGIFVAYNRPPQPVASRSWYIKMVTVCDAHDDKGNCTSDHQEPRTVYVLKSVNGGTCDDVSSTAYLTVKDGEPFKCWNIWTMGWSGGTGDGSEIYNVLAGK